MSDREWELKMSDQKLVFLDSETTSLVRWSRRPWEIALIVREPGGTAETDMEYCWQIENVDLSDADPMSLKIGKFHDRHVRYGTKRTQSEFLLPEGQVAGLVEHLTRGVTLVGAVPDFDEQTLAAMLRRHGLCPTWHYHLCDVETLAAGAMKLPPPWNFDKVLAAYGLAYKEEDRHTALGDARLVRDLYDAIMTPADTLGPSAEPVNGLPA
jgi:DNA polymerase III epsilon subunit-like protein